MELMLFLPRISKKETAEVARQGGCQVGGILYHTVMEVPRVSIQFCHLTITCLNNSLMTVPHCNSCINSSNTILTINYYHGRHC